MHQTLQKGRTGYTRQQLGKRYQNPCHGRNPVMVEVWMTSPGAENGQYHRASPAAVGATASSKQRPDQCPRCRVPCKADRTHRHDAVGDGQPKNVFVDTLLGCPWGSTTALTGLRTLSTSFQCRSMFLAPRSSPGSSASSAED